MESWKDWLKVFALLNGALACLFFILPMAGMTALFVYLTCRVIESRPWPGSRD